MKEVSANENTRLDVPKVAWTVILVPKTGAQYRNKERLLNLQCVHSATLSKPTETCIHCASLQGIVGVDCALCAYTARAIIVSVFLPMHCVERMLMHNYWYVRSSSLDR